MYSVGYSLSVNKGWIYSSCVIYQLLGKWRGLCVVKWCQEVSRCNAKLFQFNRKRSVCFLIVLKVILTGFLKTWYTVIPWHGPSQPSFYEIKSKVMRFHRISLSKASRAKAAILTQCYCSHHSTGGDNNCFCVLSAAALSQSLSFVRNVINYGIDYSTHIHFCRIKHKMKRAQGRYWNVGKRKELNEHSSISFQWTSLN